MTFFDDRAASAKVRLDALARQLKTELGTNEQRVLGRDTCIYTVGSGGRGEMSEHSDVDLFVVRVGRVPSSEDDTLVREAITRAFRQLVASRAVARWRVPQDARERKPVRAHGHARG